MRATIRMPPCEKCGSRYRRDTEHTPADCIVAVTQSTMLARDWVPVPAGRWVEVVKSAGIPHEFAPGHVVLERDPATDRHTMRTSTADAMFVPRVAISVIHALSSIRMPDPFRERAVAALWSRDDIPAALEAIDRLGGRAMGFIHQLVLQAEEDSARVAEASQHGGEESLSGPAVEGGG